MSYVREKITGLVKPLAEKRGMDFSSFSLRELEDVGSEIDGGLKISDAMDKIDKICKWKLDKYDKNEIEEALERMI